jgi:NADPH2:quinone reductase
MRAVWYERTGPAAEVLSVGELSDPEPAAGQVRVRLHFAGVNPADVKRRAGAGGRNIFSPRVIPGDDGAGVIDAVGSDAERDRIGERVWVRFANRHSAFGTSAELVCVPAKDAVRLPDGVPFDVGACLGVPALTAHRAVHADGDSLIGTTVLITGAAGVVGQYAVQLASRAGARVIATASTAEKRAAGLRAGAETVLDYHDSGVVEQVLELTGGRGAERVIDVAFGANLDVTGRIVADNGVIVAYGSDQVPTPTLPFYPLMRRGVTIRLISVFRMPPAALIAATDAITRLLTEGTLSHPIGTRLPLSETATAHAVVEGGHAIGKTLLEIA